MISSDKVVNEKHTINWNEAAVIMAMRTAIDVNTPADFQVDLIEECEHTNYVVTLHSIQST